MLAARVHGFVYHFNLFEFDSPQLAAGIFNDRVDHLNLHACLEVAGGGDGDAFSAAHTRFACFAVATVQPDAAGCAHGFAYHFARLAGQRIF